MEGGAAATGVRWHYVDNGSKPELEEVFATIGLGGPVEVLIHLAGHYDFTGENSPEYRRTNVDGMRNVRDAARDLGVRDVLFASSVAACGFPPPGAMLVASSPPDGDSPYATSKRLGEEMLTSYRSHLRPWVVRFARFSSTGASTSPYIGSWRPGSRGARVVACSRGAAVWGAMRRGSVLPVIAVSCWVVLVGRLRAAPDQCAHACSRRNASGGIESGQTGTNMAPERKVINHGATKTQRGTGSVAPGGRPAGRICTFPSGSTATSTRRADARGAPCSAQAVAATESAAADQTCSGCLGSACSAA